jgi:hypothetical protein
LNEFVFHPFQKKKARGIAKQCGDLKNKRFHPLGAHVGENRHEKDVSDGIQGDLERFGASCSAKSRSRAEGALFEEENGGCVEPADTARLKQVSRKRSFSFSTNGRARSQREAVSPETRLPWTNDYFSECNGN